MLSHLSRFTRRFASQPQQVAIIGAGVSGLYTALMLEQLNTDYGSRVYEWEIIEHQDHIGGRVITKYYDRSVPWQYSDMGAMRLPNSHTPVFDLVDYINRELKNKKLSHKSVELIEYFFDSRDASYKDKTGEGLGDTRARNHGLYYNRSFDCVALKRDIETKNADIIEKYHKAIDPLVEEQISAIKKSLGPSGSDRDFMKFLKKYSDYTTYDYLMYGENRDSKPTKYMTYDEILKYETLEGGTGAFYAGLLDQLIEETAFGSGRIWEISKPQHEWYTVKGGLGILTDRMYRLLDSRKFYFNSKVCKITKMLKADGNPGINVTWKRKPMMNPESKIYDKVFVCIPTNDCKTIDWLKFPQEKLFHAFESFRVLSNMAIFKLSLQFNYRFWEDTKLLNQGYAVIGGQSTTDLPSRWFVYPSYGYEKGPQYKGTMLIYNWATDARGWAGMTDYERVDRALTDLQFFYDGLVKTDAKEGFDVRKYFTGNYHVQDWVTSGATGLAFFNEGEYKQLEALASGLDDLVYFSGEHVSTHHTWILGAINSAAYSVKLALGENKEYRFLGANENESGFKGVEAENITFKY